jgi:hypothetical protein
MLTEKEAEQVIAEAGEGPGIVKQQVTISAPNMHQAVFRLDGTAPYMQARFSEKARNEMREKMLGGSVSKKGKKREARDFKKDFEDAMHVAEGGWCGIPAGAFRSAMIDACRVVGFKMTLAKQSIFIRADGYDRIDRTPLVRIYGKPEPNEMAVRNASGVADIRIRPMWRKWYCNLSVVFDADQFTLADVSNLLMRAGVQVGVGEGRPFSRMSHGMGMGLFEVRPK